MTEAEELARKRRLRAGHRASTTRSLGQVQTSISADPLDISKINQLRLSLEDKLQSLSDLDREILELTPEDAVETKIVQADEVKQRLYAALSKFDHCLRPTSHSGRAHTDPPTLDPPTVDPPATDPPAADPPAGDPPDLAASRTIHPVQGAKVRLPKISLPRFNGNSVRWTSFWDSYQSAIHLNADLSEVNKFNYLRSLLDSTAFDAIARLTLSSGNYKQEIVIFRKHFGIISKHMDTLMNMDAISSDWHLRDLRRLYDNTESHVCSLKSLGIEAAAYGALLSPVLLAKLPPYLRHQQEGVRL